MKKIVWYLTAPSGKKHERGFLFKKAEFKKGCIKFYCNGYNTTRPYEWLAEKNVIIK
jgi:hypothetical protein